MLILIFLQVLPDTSAVKILTQPAVTNVSIFSDSQISEIIQGVISILSLLVSGFIYYQIALVKNRVVAVKTQVDTVHNEINSKMALALQAKYDLGRAEEQARQGEIAKVQKLKDENK